VTRPVVATRTSAELTLVVCPRRKANRKERSATSIRFTWILLSNVYVHTTMKTLVLVRSRKLSIVGPG